jgi:hypothetical protein
MGHEEILPTDPSSHSAHWPIPHKQILHVDTRPQVNMPPVRGMTTHTWIHAWPHAYGYTASARGDKKDPTYLY